MKHKPGIIFSRSSVLFYHMVLGPHREVATWGMLGLANRQFEEESHSGRTFHSTRFQTHQVLRASKGKMRKNGCSYWQVWNSSSLFHEARRRNTAILRSLSSDHCRLYGVVWSVSFLQGLFLNLQISPTENTSYVRCSRTNYR